MLVVVLSKSEQELLVKANKATHIKYNSVLEKLDLQDDHVVIEISEQEAKKIEQVYKHVPALKTVVQTIRSSRKLNNQ